MESDIRRLVDWIEVPSVTGNEADYGDALKRALEKEGLGCEKQELEEGRFNVLACAGEPEVVFCTHIDTVPPFFGSSVEGGTIRGRGSCDAKGQAVAMIAAARRLFAEGEDRIGFLFTAGEEIDSAGAALAEKRMLQDELPKGFKRPRYVIIGEPTDGQFVSAHKGIYKANLCAHGVAGHSSQDIGPSAIHELIRAGSNLLESSWGEDEIVGKGTLNIGLMSGGVAPNVVAAEASAAVLLRTVEEPDVVRARIEACLPKTVTLGESYEDYGPVRFHVPEGEESKVVAFGTDAPHMRSWGQPLLYGCGSILDAHTDHEKLETEELAVCIDRHVRTVQELLAQS
ncbi:MAG: acetylornithine deacetylase [Planctomycetota bacterium]|jgi:acetylornithine deacetylase